ncbi:uncharacterized protein LOC132312369 [Cornus florida]|uniref:uncharacterized protein LOC132312369 n=1 Tax=Cornus florida TaxID=4283 RepID=UPI0028992930|nr:uncharacterized protein LOC132312369 [Cornus florida]
MENSIDDDDGARSSVFSELKAYCLELLEILQNPKKNPSTLPQLHHLLCRSPPDLLQPFFDYTLFPLLLLLDAAVECRSSRKVDSEENSVLKIPHKVSDAVAEGVLQCLEGLLKKCHLGSVDQMIVVLKKLTYGALLSPSEAAEEFREGVIRCFRALLLGLQLCSDKSCSCKQSNGLPTLAASRELLCPRTRLPKYDSESEGCLLAFLQSQSASAAVGHWLSLLLKAADIEAARGHRGSAKLRIEAFMTLRQLVAKVATADALAFFLPGVVSQFAKVLHISKSMISGAAGSVEAVDHAIRGLAEFLMIVLQDEANLSGLGMSINLVTGFHSSKDKSMQSFLEELRHLPVKSQSQSEILIEDSSDDAVNRISSKVSVKEKGSIDSGNVVGSFSVDRTKDWIVRTSAHVNKLLSATFPHLCVHPAKKVRRGLLAAIQGLLSKCSHTLKESRIMLLECLCVLVCDDSEEVSKAAQVFLGYILSSSGKYLVENDVAKIYNRLIEELPKSVLGSDESLALSHAKKLLAIIYFSGPQLVADHFCQSPVTTARFLDVFAVCLSQNSVFAGSLDKLILARPSSTGYLHSLAEMRGGIYFTNDHAIMDAASSEESHLPSSQNKQILYAVENVQKEYDIPRMPPWFVYVGSQKLYQTLAGILRLVGLSLMSDSRTEGSFSVITDIPLGYFRKLISEVRMKEYNKESWQSWYHRIGSGQLVRQASTAACILNEMIFGISDQAINAFTMMFRESTIRCEEMEGYDAGYCEDKHSFPNKLDWKDCLERGARTRLINCVGSILHEYLSPEVWNLPIEHKSSLQQPDSEAEDITSHFFHDNVMLHQVIIDGIGIFNMCLGKDFSSSGFLHSSLYALLENLTCSDFQIRSAADGVLRIISAMCGHPTVGHLVLANSDYVIDSICRQLRHLDLNPHVPNVLAAMLSYIGVAHKILPLLEEPMHSVSQELEILGRHQHPDLTIPFLKAVAEIAKASKFEACSLPAQAVSYSEHLKSKMSDMEKQAIRASSRSHYNNDIDVSPMESEDGANSNGVDMPIEQWESILFKLNDSKRYRQTVGSIVGSCLTAATPLLASMMHGICLVTLDIVEDGILALAKLEEAYKREKETKEVLERVFELCSYHHLQDALEASETGTDENRLLPAMNKIWPFLVACFRNMNPVAVRRCAGVVSNVVQICGGDFFSRRFHTDGHHFWKLLSTSPFLKKPISKEERTPLQLPYRSTSLSSEDSMAERSNLKVQVAVLNMIADLSRNKRSASALEAVLKKVSGIVVGIACSGVSGLRDASVNALTGLASLDPDLIWLLLADVYYSLKKKDMPSPPASDFPEISQILPPPLTPKGYLYVQYGGQGYGFDIDFSSVESVFRILDSQVFSSQNV